MNTSRNVHDLEKELIDWRTKIEKLKAKGDMARAETRGAKEKALADLEARYQAMHEKLKQLKQAGSEEWETLRASADKAWEEFKKTYRTLAGAEAKEPGERPQA